MKVYIFMTILLSYEMITYGKFILSNDVKSEELVTQKYGAVTLYKLVTLRAIDEDNK